MLTIDWNGLTDREERIFETIQGAGSIAIAGHVRPDQDSMGSVIAMALLLDEMCPEKDITAYLGESTVVPRYIDGLLEGHRDRFRYLDDPYDMEPVDLFICVDFGKPSRADERVRSLIEDAGDVIYIDHHYDEVAFGSPTSICDPDAVSTTELIYRLMEDANIYIYDSWVYDALYLGLVGDTGNFMNDNASFRALRLAGDLSRRMINEPCHYAKEIYRSKTVEELGCEANIIIGMRFDDGFARYVHSDCDRESELMLNDVVCPVDDVLTRIRGCLIAMSAVMDSKEGAYRVSLRSVEGIDVRKIASIFGGGGHVNASGCKLDPYDLDSLMASCRRAISAYTR